jgi:DNA-binding response OmpR family regulator
VVPESETMHGSRPRPAKKCHSKPWMCAMEKPRLLIIDDAEYLTLLYKEELLDEGYDVDVANTISEARKLLKNKLYNLVIAEIELKEKNNYVNIWDTLNQIKNELPVLINTAKQLSDVEKKQNSFESYIEKSSDISLLKEKVKVVLDKYHYTEMSAYAGLSSTVL